MDVTPPSTLRRLGIALAGLAVAALTGAACVLSFDDLRSLAVRGEARADLAYLYPAAFDALLVVALISVLLVRSARTLVRAQASLVLVLLIVAAATVNVLAALRYAFPIPPTAVGVAVAPWVMLAVALWLWLLLIKHVQARRSSPTSDDGTDPHDIVPFDAGVRTEPAPRPGGHHEISPPLGTPSAAVPPPRRATPLESTPVVGPTAAPETPPISEQVTRWHATPEPAPEPRPDHADGPESAREPEQDDASEPASKPDADPEPEPEPQSQPATEGREPESEADVAPEEADDVPEKVDAGPEVEAESPPRLRRPVRWGDRVKPTDVLVHPRQSRAAEKDVDTQPVPVIADTPSAREGTPSAREGASSAPADAAASQQGRDTAPVPDPHHGAEAADEHERRDAGAPGTGGAAELRDESMEDTAPHPVLPDSSHAHDAPSGRLRSTPLPPED